MPLSPDDMNRLQAGEHINPEPDIEAMLRSGRGWGKGDWSNPPQQERLSDADAAYLKSLKPGDQFCRVIDGAPMDWLVVREIRDGELICDRQTGGAGGFQVRIGLPRERARRQRELIPGERKTGWYDEWGNPVEAPR